MSHKLSSVDDRVAVPASRRHFFVGAAAVGAVATGAAVLRGTGEPAPDVPASPVLPPAPEKGGGYSLSEHVKRYYTTAST